MIALRACGYCDGRGWYEISGGDGRLGSRKECSHCDGSGIAMVTPQWARPNCPRCGGFGITVSGTANITCPRCNGTGYVAPLAPDVVELVIAARIVAFEDQSPAALRRLDEASEAFADRVPWDDEPPRDWGSAKSNDLRADHRPPPPPPDRLDVLHAPIGKSGWTAIIIIGGAALISLAYLTVSGLAS